MTPKLIISFFFAKSHRQTNQGESENHFQQLNQNIFLLVKYVQNKMDEQT